MHTVRHAVWVILAILMFVAPPQKGTFAEISTQRPPEGFTLERSSLGVALYKSVKPYEESRHFMQVVDLSLGASVELLHGSFGEAQRNPGKGMYGCRLDRADCQLDDAGCRRCDDEGCRRDDQHCRWDDPDMEKQLASEVWPSFVATNERAFCISNGQFFPLNYPTARLAFPLKKDGEPVSGGYEARPKEEVWMLEIWENRVEITELTTEALARSDAPDIIGGLNPDPKYVGDKDPYNELKERTFVGIADDNNDGQYETLLILNSKGARQDDAARVLRSFGAKKVMMLDGGGSTQLVCRGTVYISTNRKVPQFLAVAAALPRPDSTVVHGCDEVTLHPGEPGEITFELKNIGNVTWEPDQGYALINTNQQTLGASPKQTLASQVPRGEVIPWVIPITAPLRLWAGSYTTTWQMAWNEERFGAEVSCPVSVSGFLPLIPELIKSKLTELWEKLRVLVLAKLSELWENLMQQLEEWLERELEQGWRDFWDNLIRQCCGANALAPATLLLAAVGINRKRRRR